MAMFLSFLGGAARQLTTDIEKAEENAREDAKLGFSALYKRYEENSKANRELTSKMAEDEQWIKTNYESATPEQIAALVGNPVALEALKKTDDPYKIDLNNYIKIAQGNESPAVQAERIQALPSFVGKIKESMSSKMAPTEGKSPIGSLIKDFGDTSFESTTNRLAKSQGLSMADLQATSRMARPTTAAKFDMAATEQFKSVEDIAKAAQLDRFQAEQKFGKDSDQYKAANAKFTAASNEIVRADKKLEDRRDRLEIQRQDSKGDPALIAALTKEIDGLNADIKARREATSTNRERAGTGEDKITYAKAKTRIEDYMNTDMTANKGLGWRKHVEDKVVTDPATGKTITIPGKKVGLTPEQEKEYIDGMNQARMQGLKDLGLVTEKGQAVNNEVKSLMTAYGFGRPAASAQPAPAASPTTQPTATPAQPAVPVKRPKPTDAPPDAKLAPDGHWYSQDKQTGKYLKWSN